MYRGVIIVCLAAILTSGGVLAQSAEYEAKKTKALAQKSVFEKIVDRELPATILYEDEEILAFIPLRNKLRYIF